jgi:hypothetical protein
MRELRYVLGQFAKLGAVLILLYVLIVAILLLTIGQLIGGP